MKVVMKVSLSGLREGATWPETGEVADLPEAEAKDMIHANLAALPEKPEKAVAPKPQKAAAPKPEKAVAPKAETRSK